MCGLTGFLNTHSPTASPQIILTHMMKQLTHRGPDDHGMWWEHPDGIGLAHTRLSIVDLSSAGHQPMQSQDGRYVMVYNGEIYNFDILKKQLQAKGCVFVGRSDTEVILALILEYGLEQSLKLISGMFALALWDRKEKILHLARDRIGEKPLYYGLVNGAFVFGSELKAIRAYPNFNNPINSSSLSLFLQYGYVPTPHAIYENIYKLPAGSYLSINQTTLHNFKTTNYWSAADTAHNSHLNPLDISDKDAIFQTEELLSNIVKSRMVSDVPIGSFLSGGIDSSLITALMQINSNKPIKTFTIGFNVDAYNEAEHAKAIAHHLNTDHTEFYVDAKQAWSVIPQLPHIYDEPFADPSAIPTFLVSQLTRQQVSVCLSGDGGDELFGGYNRYLLGQTLWKKLTLFPYPIRLALRKFLLCVPPAYWQQILKFTHQKMIGDKLHKFAASLSATSSAHFYQYLITQWHQKDSIVKKIHSNPNYSTSLHQNNNLSFIEKMMLTDTLSYLPDNIMVKVDRAGMAVSLETRAPYLDHELFEFVWKLPFQMKIRQHSTKWMLRQILANYVPSKLFERPKMGFGVPLDSWLRGPLRDWAEGLLNKNLIEQQGFLHVEPILKKWQEHLSGKRNWQYQLWTILMFQAWMGKNEKERQSLITQ